MPSKNFRYLFFFIYSQLQSAIEEFQIFGKKTDTGSNNPGPVPMFRSWIWPGPVGPETTSAGDKLKVLYIVRIKHVFLCINMFQSLLRPGSHSCIQKKKV